MPAGKKTSIRDIGKELGISTTTISFILNGKAKENRISEALTQKVLKFVEEVNFKPNLMAQGLRTGKSKIICLMVEDISNNLIFAQVARLIEEAAHHKGYRVIYCSTENKKEKAVELISLFRERSIDGYIITPPLGIESEIQSLLNEGIPVVLIDRDIPGIDCNCVVIDNENSTTEAISHLIKNGYKNIAFVTLESEQSQMLDRLKGYEKAIQKSKLTPYIKKVAYHESENQNIQEIESFLQDNAQLDAVFFSTNYIGLWGLQALKKCHLNIPSDLAVVSFDDQELYKFYSPSITAISQPIRGIANHVTQLMFNAIQEKDRNVQKIVLPAQLIERESSMPLLSSKEV